MALPGDTRLPTAGSGFNRGADVVLDLPTRVDPSVFVQASPQLQQARPVLLSDDGCSWERWPLCDAAKRK